MRDGQCPKCGSATVYTLTNGVVPGGRDREYIQFSGMYSAVDIQSYVCATCGYYENYLVEPKRLAEVAEKWPAVPPKTPVAGR